MRTEKIIFLLSVFLCCLLFFFGCSSLFDGSHEYDADWIQGKTLAEVSDRYGAPDVVENYWGVLPGYKMGHSSVLVLHFADPNDDAYNPDAVVKSTQQMTIGDPEEWGEYYEHFLFLNWAKGKDLETVLSASVVPEYCIPQETVVYAFGRHGPYVILSLEHTEGGTYMVRDSVDGTVQEDAWQPWDPALFGIASSSEAETSSSVPWPWIALPAGVVVIGGGAAVILLRRKKKKAVTTEE